MEEELTQICIENERFEDGLYFANAVLEIAPYNSDYWMKKGTCLNNIFEFENALECFNKALSLNPSDSELLL